MHYLLAGYKNGYVALWDINSNKLEKLMTDIHESEVTVVKIQHINEENVITIITAEAKGKVFITEISYGGFFTGI